MNRIAVVGADVLFPVPGAILAAAVAELPSIEDDRLAALVEELALAAVDCYEDARRTRVTLRAALGRAYEQERELRRLRDSRDRILAELRAARESGGRS